MIRPDIYIGLVGAAGTDLEPLKSQLTAQFAALGYHHETIKISHLIAEAVGLDASKITEDERIRYLMDVGDAIRASVKNGDGVMSLAVADIRNKRTADEDEDKEKLGFKGSTVFIIDSLKNPAEIVALDSIYARNYYTISVYSPESIRKDRLSKLIAKSRRETRSEKHFKLAAAIMKEDDGRKPEKLAQDVLGTFPRADFFIRTDGNISNQLKRFVELVFGNPFITPTQDEHFMHLARTASLRSCDLSRQVGAVIVDARGAVISQGCNEVPYPGGGIYYEGRPNSPDNRDHVDNKDPNQAEITEVVKDFVATLRKVGLMSPSNLDNEQFTWELLFGQWKEATAEARIRNLIEFGKIVHAEMHAICEAARLGREIDGASLYCTTFPCHGCARHIIATGIKEVIFIEPYPKSLTKALYSSEIKTDDNTSNLPGAVEFRPFEGVSPVLFRRVFNFRQRKTADGSTVKWSGLTASPLKAVKRVLNYEKETEYIKRLDLIKEVTVLPPSPAPV